MATLRDRWNKQAGKAHNGLYRVSKGRLGSRLGPRTHVLLLTTTGRTSGRPITKPLIYVPDGDRFVVTASNAGQPHDPQWYRNLLASPEAVVQVGDRRVEVRARVADESEKEAFWPRLVASLSWFEGYRQKAGRPIPVVLLEPR